LINQNQVVKHDEYDVFNNDTTTQLADITKKVIINVMDYGAKGDGVTDDTQACINAFNFAATIENIPKVIIFPYSANSYMINGTSSDASEADYGRLRIPSNTTIDLCGSTLTIIPNTAQHSSIFRADTKNDIVVRNGYLYGDYVQGTTKTGEWQFGVSILSCANIRIERVKCYNMRGDGLYFGYSDVSIPNQNIIVDQCYVSTVWRNGISVTSGKNVVIKNSTIENTTGLSLGAGIDFEPDHDVDSQYIQDSVIKNCQFNNIQGSAWRFQYSKNCEARNNKVNGAINGFEVREAYDIEIYKNRFKNLAGIYILGDSASGSGNIYIRKNIVENFNAVPPSGYSSIHINLGGTTTPVYFYDNTIKNPYVGYGIIYVGSGTSYVERNRFYGAQYEVLRTRNSAIATFYSNEITNYTSGAVNLLRARDTSSLDILFNRIVGIPFVIANNETGVFHTDVLHAQPTLGTYSLGDFVKNNYYTPSTTGTSGWLCTTAGTINNTAWVASTAYAIGVNVNANGNVYQCTTAGTSGSTAPSGTGTSITDGTVVWKYINPLAIFRAVTQ
jgi:hypothetical protein